jgi:hypothetical protein
MIIELLRWWYGPGWVLAWRRIGVRNRNVSHAFSAPILLQTLFSPWKRIVSTGAKGIDQQFRAAMDNLVSRTIGFFVRLMVLIAAAVMLTGTFLLSLAIVLVWPFVPLLIIFCLVRSVI